MPFKLHVEIKTFIAWGCTCAIQSFDAFYGDLLSFSGHQWCSHIRYIPKKPPNVSGHVYLARLTTYMTSHNFWLHNDTSVPYDVLFYGISVRC